jgi:hypothetical protein
VCLISLFFILNLLLDWYLTVLFETSLTACQYLAHLLPAGIGSQDSHHESPVSPGCVDLPAFTIPSPPMCSAASYEDLIATLSSHGQRHGYAVCKSTATRSTNSDGTKGAYSKGYAVCDRSGKRSCLNSSVLKPFGR